MRPSFFFFLLGFRKLSHNTTPREPDCGRCFIPLRRRGQFGCRKCECLSKKLPHSCADDSVDVVTLLDVVEEPVVVLLLDDGASSGFPMTRGFTSTFQKESPNSSFALYMYRVSRFDDVVAV